MRNILCCMVMFIAVFMTSCNTGTLGNSSNSEKDDSMREREIRKEVMR